MFDYLFNLGAALFVAYIFYLNPRWHNGNITEEWISYLEILE